MKTPEANDLGGGLVPESVGSLNLRQEVMDGFLSVRQKHEQLQALLHQVMRKVALPRCKEIGIDLLAIKSFYPKGKKGTASKFYEDAEKFTTLKKASIANYIQIAENWERLMDYLGEIPEGGTPITSLRGALAAIREMNKPLQVAGKGDAIDVHAEAVEGDDQQDSPAGKRTNYAASARKAMKDQFTALKSVKVLTPLHRDRLDKIQEMLQILLDDIDRLEGDAAVPTVVEVKPKLDTSNVATVSPRPTGAELKAEFMAAAKGGARSIRDFQPKGVRLSPPVAAEDRAIQSGGDAPTKSVLPNLAELYPLTKEGLEALETAMADHGSGAALGRHLGNTSKNPSRWITNHRALIKEALPPES